MAWCACACSARRGFCVGPIKTGDNGYMARVPTGFVNQIDSGVQKAERALAPAVVRIRYSLDSDWTGDPSIFFRIVLSDEASGKAQLSEIAHRVALAILNEVKPEELGLHSYFNFRSLSEQEQLKEPAWA
jgi:hypothetical protein